MNFLTGIPLKLYGYLAALFAILAAIWKVYSAGKNAARVEGLEHAVRNTEVKEKVDEGVDRLPDGGAADRLRERWSRD